MHYLVQRFIPNGSSEAGTLEREGAFLKFTLSLLVDLAVKKNHIILYLNSPPHPHLFLSLCIPLFFGLLG